MTTIVYHHESKTIVCDSRLLSGHSIKSEVYEKFIKTDKAMYFFAGTVADIKNYIDAHEVVWDKSVDINCDAIIVEQGKVYMSGMDKETGPFRFELTFTDAIGSGDHYARAFIASGMSPENAIESTMKLDAGTGGKIRTYSVDKERFIN